MKMYTTITEAITICGNTYKGRTYRVVDTLTGEYKEGSAYDIISWMADIELSGRDSTPVALALDDVECWALLEVILTMERVMQSGIRFLWEAAARDLYNQIIADAEDK